MKRTASVLFAALLVSICSHAFASITIDEPFTEYGDVPPGKNLVDPPAGGGTGWGDNKWTLGGGIPEFWAYWPHNPGLRCGRFFNSGSSDLVYRNFVSPINNITSFTFDMISGDNEPPTTDGIFISGNGANGTDPVIKIGFSRNEGVNGEVGAYSGASQTWVKLADWGYRETYNFTISLVDFENHLYKVTAAGSGSTGEKTIDFISNIDNLSYVGMSANNNPAGNWVGVSNINIVGDAVPEPSTVAFFVVGLLGIAGGMLKTRLNG